MDLEPHRTLGAEDILNLLKILADTVTSRSMKEQLHSRLLCDSLTEAEIIERSIQGFEMLYSLGNIKPEPSSHFSDSSDDEMTEGSEYAMEDFSNSFTRCHSGPNRERKVTKVKGPQFSNETKKEDQEVFDLEL